MHELIVTETNILSTCMNILTLIYPPPTVMPYDKDHFRYLN